jgi:ankyrin repeat protein
MGASTPLHTAAVSGDREVVRSLLEGGADPNACDERGCTPLHAALQNKRLQVARMLIAAGSRLEACNAEGVSARDLAAALGLWESES